MITTTLAFEKIRKTGQLPQIALVIRTIVGDLVFAQDGMAFADAISPTATFNIYYFDGGRNFDGTIRYGAQGLALQQYAGQAVYRGLLRVGALDEGDDGQGIVSVLSSRAGTVTVTMDNADGRLSDLILTAPLVGSDADVVLSFPGLTVDDVVRRYSGVVSRLTLTDDTLELERRTP
jgi:hypothetical protein